METSPTFPDLPAITGITKFVKMSRTEGTSPALMAFRHPILKELGESLDEFKVNGKPIKLARINVAAKAVRMLFKQLLLTLYDD